MDDASVKFGSVSESQGHDYGNVYYREETDGGRQRLVIGPSSGFVSLLLSLAATWRTYRFAVLYVLLVPRTGANQPGRYQSPPIESLNDLRRFMEEFEDFFEGDGRHHVWIASFQKEGTLVYDQHNVIFAYGDLNRYEEVLRNAGFRQKQFWFPTPHFHSFRSKFDALEDRLLSEFVWRRTPLQQGDEWD